MTTVAVCCLNCARGSVWVEHRMRASSQLVHIVAIAIAAVFNQHSQPWVGAIFLGTGLVVGALYPRHWLWKADKIKGSNQIGHVLTILLLFSFFTLSVLGFSFCAALLAIILKLDYWLCAKHVAMFSAPFHLILLARAVPIIYDNGNS